MVKAVLFDFWGTLVENGTYSPVKQAYKILQVRQTFDQFVEHFEEVLMTKTYEDQTQAFTAVCTAFDIKPNPYMIDRLIGVWNKNRLFAKLYPDAKDMLEYLKENNVKAIIVSNAPQNNVEPIIETNEIGPLFTDIILSYKEGLLKTNGLIQKALEIHDLKPEDVIFIGDSIQSDMKGAEKAGVKAYLLDRTDGRNYPNKIAMLTDIKDLVK